MIRYTQGNLLDNTLPDFGVPHHLGNRLEALKIKVALVLLGRVALETILIQERADGLLEQLRG